MLFDVDFRVSNGSGYPVFFDATLRKGVLRIPDALYADTQAASRAG
jgi:hypothetical protein